MPDYILIPKEKSRTKEIELIVADPNEGFHRLLLPKEKSEANQIKQPVEDPDELPEEEDGNEAKFYSDFSLLGMEECDGLPLGKIEKFALTPTGGMLAIYTDADRGGDLIVIKSNFD